MTILKNKDQGCARDVNFQDRDVSPRDQDKTLVHPRQDQDETLSNSRPLQDVIRHFIVMSRVINDGKRTFTSNKML